MNQGFSIIELMVSVGIIAIITSIATVVYPTYTSRSQVSYTVLLLESYIKAAESYYVEHNTNNNGFSGITNISTLGGYTEGTNNTDIISGISVSSTATTLTLAATFNNNANSRLSGKNLNLTITADTSGSFTIGCSTSGISSDYVPSKCR